MDKHRLNTWVLSACSSKDISELTEALAAGADANYCPPSLSHGLHSPMQIAASANFVAGLAKLLEAGGDVNSTANGTSTPLMAAATHGGIDAGRWLLAQGANAEFVNRAGHSAISLACFYNQADFADMLLHERPNIRSQLFDFAPNLIRVQNPSLVKWLLEQGISPDQKSRDTDMPWIACAQNFSDRDAQRIIDMLLGAGANVNGQDCNGDTALHRALDKQGHEGFLKLLRAGADPDIPNRAGTTARHLVSRCGDEALVSAFQAWTASMAAHKMMHEASAAAGLKPI